MTVCLAPVRGSARRGELGELENFPPMDSFQLSADKRATLWRPFISYNCLSTYPSMAGQSLGIGDDPHTRPITSPAGASALLGIASVVAFCLPVDGGALASCCCVTAWKMCHACASGKRAGPAQAPSSRPYPSPCFKLGARAGPCRRLAGQWRTSSHAPQREFKELPLGQSTFLRPGHQAMYPQRAGTSSRGA